MSNPGYRIFIEGNFVPSPDFRSPGDPFASSDNYDEWKIGGGLETRPLWGLGDNKETLAGSVTVSGAYRKSKGDIHTFESGRQHFLGQIGINQQIFNWFFFSARMGIGGGKKRMNYGDGFIPEKKTDVILNAQVAVGTEVELPGGMAVSVSAGRYWEAGLTKEPYTNEAWFAGAALTFDVEAIYDLITRNDPIQEVPIIRPIQNLGIPWGKEAGDKWCGEDAVGKIPCYVQDTNVYTNINDFYAFVDFYFLCASEINPMAVFAVSIDSAEEYLDKFKIPIDANEEIFFDPYHPTDVRDDSLKTLDNIFTSFDVMMEKAEMAADHPLLEKPFLFDITITSYLSGPEETDSKRKEVAHQRTKTVLEAMTQRLSAHSAIMRFKNGNELSKDKSSNTLIEWDLGKRIGLKTPEINATIVRIRIAKQWEAIDQMDVEKEEEYKRMKEQKKGEDHVTDETEEGDPEEDYPDDFLADF